MPLWEHKQDHRVHSLAHLNDSLESCQIRSNERVCIQNISWRAFLTLDWLNFTLWLENFIKSSRRFILCVFVCVPKTNSKWCRGTTTSNFWALRIKTFLSTLRILLHFFLPCFCVARDVFMYQSTSQGLRRMHNSYFATKLQSSLSVTALGSLFKIRWI